jgi:hypothetical protein
LNWNLDYTDAALQDLAAVPLELQGAVESHLLRLAAAPVSLSRKAVFPYAGPGQIFPFTVTSTAGRLHHFTVFFLYDQDEQLLHVARVVYQSR